MMKDSGKTDYITFKNAVQDACRQSMSNLIKEMARLCVEMSYNEAELEIVSDVVTRLGPYSNYFPEDEFVLVMYKCVKGFNL